MKTCVILNPNAGTAGEVSALENAVSRLGDEVNVCVTQEAGDAKKIAHEAVENGCELVVAAGGDGTLNEVLNGMAVDFGRSRLGLIPMGTGNDFARSINVPADLEKALDILAAGQTKTIDVVRYSSEETRYFINVSAGGFSGLVNEVLTDDMKKSWGPLAYLRSAAAAIPNLTDYETIITFDNEEKVRLSIYNIVLANARYVAGGTMIAPNAILDDGLLDIVIVPAASVLELAVLAPQILLGSHLESDLIVFRRASKVVLASKPGMWFNVDGELMSKEPATFEVLPRALQVVVGS